MNESIDMIFPAVYAIFALALLAACVIIFRYYCMKDSPSARDPLPWAFIIAAIANLLIGLWIIVYFVCLYKYDDVWIPSNGSKSSIKKDSSKGEEDEPEWMSRYDRYHKGWYVFDQCLGPILFFLVYLLIWFTVKYWVDVHKGQPRAWG